MFGSSDSRLYKQLNIYYTFRTYCLGWKPPISDDCIRMQEFEFKSEAERKSSPVDALYRKYTGGGYELRIKVNTITDAI